MAIYDRERSKVTLPQLERRLENVENGVDVKCVDVMTDEFSVSTTTTVSKKIKEIKGYTAFAVSAYMHGAGSNYGYCNIFNVRIEKNTAKCGVRFIVSNTQSAPTSAENVKVRFRILYIADKMLTAATATATSSGGGGGGGGTRDYTYLENKPSIEMVTLEGNKNFEDLGLMVLTNVEIQRIIS